MSISSFKRTIIIFSNKNQYDYEKLMPMVFKVVSSVGH